MRIIEHSTTPHDVVNSLSHCGTKSQKMRYLSQPSSFPECHTQQPVSASGPASVCATQPGVANFLKPNAAQASRQILGGHLNLISRKSAEGSTHQEPPSRWQNRELVVCRKCERVIGCGQHRNYKFHCLFTNSYKTNCLSGLVHFHRRTSSRK